MISLIGTTCQSSSVPPNFEEVRNAHARGVKKLNRTFLQAFAGPAAGFRAESQPTKRRLITEIQARVHDLANFEICGCGDPHGKRPSPHDYGLGAMTQLPYRGAR